MRVWVMAMGAALVLASSTAMADDKNPDLVDRLGRALQNNDSRDRAPNYGSSGYDRDRDRTDGGRGDSAYSERQRRADEQRRLDDQQRELDRRRRQLEDDRTRR